MVHFFVKNTQDLIILVNAQTQQARVTNWKSSANLNQWYHLAFIGDGTNIKLYVDGIQKGNIGSQVSFTPGPLEIGRRDSTSSIYLDGYIDEFRVSKGIARWTENFTPPTRPYFDASTAPTVALIDPGVSFGTDSTPTFRISRVADGYTVGLYKSLGTGCDVFLKYVVATGPTIDITTEALSEGLHSIYAKVENNGSNIPSYCSTEGASYAYDTEPSGIDSNVVLMIHGDENDQNFVDSSYKQHNITVPSNDANQVSPTTAGIEYPAGNPAFGNVMYFDGDGDYLSIPDSNDWDIVLENFTLDFWIKTSSTRGEIPIGRDSITGNVTNGFWFFDINNGIANKISFYQYPTTVMGNYPALISTSDINDNNWHHVAVARSGTSIKIFIDGIVEDSATYTQDNTLLNTDLSIGKWFFDWTFTGYLDEIRISKGVARWTANFTPPIRPYYDIPAEPTIALQDPTSSPSNDTTPTFRISGVRNGYTVGLYQSTGSGCDTQLKQSTASGTTIDITTDPLTDGTYSMYAIVENNGSNLSSSCSTSGANYTLDSTAPDPPSALTLTEPAPNSGPPYSDSTPSINISGVENGDSVRLYFDSSCSNLAASGTASDTTIKLTSSEISSFGTQSYYADRTDPAGNKSSCSAAFEYLYYPYCIPIDSYTKLLVHSNTIDGGTNFTDVSASSHTLNRNGGILHSTDQKKFGISSIEYIAANSQYITIPNSDDWNFGTGAFTIDFWTRLKTVDNVVKFVSTNSGSSSYYTPGWYINYHPTNGFRFDSYNGGWHTGISASQSAMPNIDTWHHIAVTRDGSGNMRFFINGFQVGTTVNDASNILSGAQSLFLGGMDGTYSSSMDGYIDEVRISKGIARWTADFNPPTKPYCNNQHGNDTYTKLLIHSDSTDGSTTFNDSSSENHSITPQGDVHHKADQKKFGDTSIYFDGTGDYLNIADSDDWSFGSDDFTIDFWIRRGSMSESTMVMAHTNGGSQGPLNIFWNIHVSELEIYGSTDGSQFNFGNGDSFGAITENTWHHIAVVRDGNTLRLFKDGTQQTTVDVTGKTPMNATGDFQIGARNEAQFFIGYLDEIRISKGIARWTENFTVPNRAYLYTPDTPTIALLDPSNSPYGDTTPTFRISGVVNGYTVGLYKSTGSGCDVPLKYAVATGPTVDITTDELTEGTYSIYTKVANNGSNFPSSCSTTGSDYVIDLTTPDLSAGAETVLLIHSDATTGSTTFADSSSNNFTVTAHGSAQHNETYAHGEFGKSAMDFDGVDSCIKAMDSESESLYMAGNPFTIDLWTRFEVFEETWFVAGIGNSTGDRVILHLFNSGTNLRFVHQSGGSNVVELSAAHGMSAGEWHHIAVVRDSSNNWNLYLDGISIASGTDTYEVSEWKKLFIGCGANTYTDTGFSYINGQIDELRVSTTARWTANFSDSLPNSQYYSVNLSVNAPASSPSNNSTPTIQIEGVHLGDTVYLYSDNTCSNQVASGTASDTTINLTSSPLADGGTYNFYIKVQNAIGNISSCGTATVEYVYNTSQYLTIKDHNTLNNDLVSYWSLDESSSGIAYDEKGVNNGVIMGDPTTDAPVMSINSSLLLDGTGDFVELAGDGAITDQNNFSISLWIKRTTTTEIVSPKMLAVIGNYDGTAVTGWQLNMGRTGLLGNGVLGFYDLSSWKSSGLSILDTNWHHVVLVVPPTGNRYIWLDGVQGNAIAEAVIPAPNKKLNLGYNQGEPQNALDGNVDEVGYWNRVLTADEISDLYNDGRGKTYDLKLDTTSIGGIDSSTVLILHGDGSGQDFIDSSLSPHTVTIPSGQVTHISPATEGIDYPAGNSAFDKLMYFDGSSYLKVDSTNDVDFSESKIFTIDMWIRLPEQPLEMGVMGAINQSGSRNGWGINVYYDGVNRKLQFFAYSASNQGSSIFSNGLSANQWYHFAVVGDGTNVKLYINGMMRDTTGISNLASNTTLSIGKTYYDTNYYFTGYIDELRISKGITRWTENFSPPNKPYSSVCTAEDSNTVLLLHSDTINGDTNFTDSSVSGHSITPYGDTKHSTANKKFGNTSIYFDGDGDYMTISDSEDWNFGGGDFTIDFWVHFTELGSSQKLIKQRVDNGNMWAVSWEPTDGIRFFSYNSMIKSVDFNTGTNGWAINTWYHVSVVRNSSSWKIYRNGELLGSATSSAAMDNYTSDVEIGRWSQGQYPFTGYIDEIRISKGIARWTTNFTPPNYPHCGTDILACNYVPGNSSNTVLLLHSDTTDASTTFTDSSVSGHSITPYGDTKHSTADKKFGNSSIYFDGNGNYLDITHSADWEFGSGTFTIDFWINLDGALTESNVSLINHGGSGLYTDDADGWILYYSNVGNFTFYLMDADPYVWGNSLGASGTLVSHQWHHVAVTRESDNNVAIYLDGTLLGSKKLMDHDIPTVNMPLRFGRAHPGDDTGTNKGQLKGYLDEIRISKGIVRWTSNFTAPTKPYCDIGIGPSAPTSCPTGFIPVEGNFELGVDGFCVAKYEMKGSSGSISSTATGTPYVSINATSAFSECSSMSETGFESGSFALISNPQWMTIARDIERVDSNWSGGSVGSGTLARGWSAHISYGDSWTNTAAASSTGTSCLYNSAADTCASSGDHIYKRTLTLNNSEEIWDFSGDVWEWVDWDSGDSSFTSGPTSCTDSNWNEFSTDCITLSTNDYKPTSGYTSTQGTGKWVGGTGGAVRRSGMWNNASEAGIYTIGFDRPSSNSSPYIGFRCVWIPD